MDRVIHNSEYAEPCSYDACDSCGKVSPDNQWLPDPFLEEIYGEVEYGWWCDNCFHSRADDI